MWKKGPSPLHAIQEAYWHHIRTPFQIQLKQVANQTGKPNPKGRQRQRQAGNRLVKACQSEEGAARSCISDDRS